MHRSLTHLARALREGEASAAALVAGATVYHEQLGGPLGAYRRFDGEASRRQAHAADSALAAGADPGPLVGIPISVKDLYAVDGWDTYAGSPHPLPDSWTRAGPLVRALCSQLAVLTGKTHTVEFAFGGIGTNPHWPTPRNPWDDQVHRVPGGSSAGAGVSVLEGSAKIALGTDTAGSVRIPASFTGCVGLKTSVGRWPTGGIVPLSPTLDTAGVLTRDVEDAIYTFGALDPTYDGPDDLERELETLGAPDLRIGTTDSFFWDACSAGVAEGVQGALEELVRQGARLRALDLPEAHDAHALFRTGGPVAPELYAFLRRELPGWMDTLDPNVAARVQGGRDLSAADYIDRLRQLQLLAQRADETLRPVDVLAVPTVPITPPTVDEVSTADGYRHANLLALRNTAVANYLGLCALTLPVARDAAGMPVGIQLLARAGAEPHLLAVARAIEHALGNAQARLGTPPLTRME